MDNLTKLRYWTFKILPLVYDDSLSYYEVLTKVTNKVNELVNSNNAMPQTITDEITKQLDESYAIDINNKINKLANEVYAKLITAIATDEGTNTFTKDAKSGGELIFLNNTLYKVTAVMPAGTNYIIGTNIVTVDISKELKDIKETYLASNNEHWNDRSANDYNTGVYLYWKDILYITTKDIKTNDILYSNGDNQNLRQVTLAKEISDNYNEMHEVDNNLQVQINENDNDINKLQTDLTNEVSRATNRENSIDGRISNIVAQSGNDNTEIVDARKTADIFGGKVDSTIGDAIRSQVTINANLSSGDRPIRCLIPAGQTWGKIYAKQNDKLLAIPSDTITLPIKYMDPLPTDKVSLFFTDIGGNDISYYQIGGNIFKEFTLDPNYFTIPEYYYAHLAKPVSYPVSIINVTRSIELNGAGTNQFVKPCYIQGKIKYSISKQDIYVTLPITGYKESYSGHIGYYSAPYVTEPYEPIKVIIGDHESNFTINDAHTTMQVRIPSGYYLIYNGKLRITSGVIESIPICGNINGNFLNYTGNIPENITPGPVTISYEENNSSLLTIQRFGLGYGQPESPDSVIKALRAGFNGVRLNLQFTADNVPVCWHDPSVNQYYNNVYDSDGNLVPYSESNKIEISKTNITDLDKYHWGGTSYTSGIPKLINSITPFRPANKILVIEQKANWNSEQCAILARIIRQNGMANKTYIAVSSSSQADLVHNAIPECYVGWAGVSIANCIDEYSNRAEQGYHLFWWGWNTTKVTDSQVATLSRLGIIFWAGDFNTQQDITTFMNTECNKYCTGVETNIPFAGTEYFNTVIPKILN